MPPTIKRITKSILSVLVLVWIILSFMIYLNQTNLVYVPSKTYIENYFGYVVLAIFLIQSFFVYKRIYLPKIYIGFFIFLLMSFIALFFYPSDDSFDLLLSLLQIFIFSIVVYNILIYNDSALSLEIGIVFGLIYSVYIGYFVGRDFFTGFLTQRYSGTLANPNHYSFMITVALLFLIRRFLLFSRSRDKANFYNYIIVFLILVFSYEVIFYALSRQGILIVFILLLFLFYQTLSQSSNINKIFIVLIFLSLFFYTYNTIINNELLYNRLGALFSLFSTSDEFLIDNSLVYRFRYMIDAYKLWLEKPIFGYGLHQFKYVNNSGVSHNNFLEILVNNGIIGFISYYSLYIYIFKSYFLIRSYNRIDSNWLITVLLMLFIADMTVISYIEKPNWLIFSTVLYVISLYNKNQNIIIRI